MQDLIFATAQEIASAIRQRQVSSLEVVEAHLAQIARHNAALNAVCTLDEEGARRRAKEADAALARNENWGPLHGVPVTFKDTYETAGIRTTSGYKPLANYVPDEDATVVARLRAAGAVILGKTNLAMLATDWQSTNPLFGAVNNPWDIKRTAGGSSGGSAVAVAMGFSALDIGSDLGGSIRVPAHFCGVYGLKPTQNRVSAAGHIPDWHIPGSRGATRTIRHMATYGPLARSVEDLRLALTLISGPDGRQPGVAAIPLDAAPELALKQYRFAWTDKFGNVPVTAETGRALEKLAGTLTNLGCRVERVNPPDFDFEEAWQTWGEIIGHEIGAAIPVPMRLVFKVLFTLTGRKAPINQGVIRGTSLNTVSYLKALTRLEMLTEKMEHFLAGWDGWLCPVTTGPAFTHRQTGSKIEVDNQKLAYTSGVAAYTSVFNLTGHPVVTLPLTRTNEGLPVGVQLVGQHWSEMKLLNMAGHIEKLTGAYQRPRLANQSEKELAQPAKIS